MSELLSLPSSHHLLRASAASPDDASARKSIHAFLSAFPPLSMSRNILNTCLSCSSILKVPKHYQLVSHLILKKRSVARLHGNIEEGTRNHNTKSPVFLAIASPLWCPWNKWPHEPGLESFTKFISIWTCKCGFAVLFLFAEIVSICNKFANVVL